MHACEDLTCDPVVTMSSSLGFMSPMALTGTTLSGSNGARPTRCAASR